tara:strand:+ start:3139 stop:3720 length:582 start_codon:yes stop_codon:yes gene_type:complete
LLQIIKVKIASAGMNWKHFHSWPLFGDGAAAVIIEHDGPSRLKGYLHQTFSEGRDLCRVVAGGIKRNIRSVPQPGEDEYLFSMLGHKVYKLAAKKLPLFLERLLEQNKVSIDDIDLFIPHQASGMALAHFRKRLSIDRSRMVETYPRLGNQIAASIPSALHEAIVNQRVLRGSRVMLIGSAAGLSLAGLVLEV